MSQFCGRYYRRAMRDRREVKRLEAHERNGTHPAPIRRKKKRRR